MERRRLSLLGKTALQAAYWCAEGLADAPVVMASRYGDAGRSLALLAEQARDQPLSPTAFGLSVHNAIGALYSISRADRGNHVSVSAGAASAAAAVVEAVALLHDGADDVLIVCYDAPLPEPYAAFDDAAACRYAWAWRVALPQAGDQCRFELSVEACTASQPVSAQHRLPFGLDVLRFMLSGDPELRRDDDDRVWTWRRHA